MSDGEVVLTNETLRSYALLWLQRVETESGVRSYKERRHVEICGYREYICLPAILWLHVGAASNDAAPLGHFR